MKNEIIWVEPEKLKINQYHTLLYGINEVIDPILECSIKLEGIKEPLIITKSFIIISGVLRWRIAYKLQLKLIPVIFSNLENETLLAVITHNQQRQKSITQRFREYQFLKKEYSVGKGYRSDLDIDKNNEKSLSQLQKMVNLSASSISRLEEILNILDIKNTPDEKTKILEKLDTGEASISGLLLSLRNDDVSTKSEVTEPFNNGKYQKSKVLLLNKSCEDLTDLEDNSVQVVISSPGYYKLRKYGNGKDEIGRETSINQYLTNLIKLINGIKPKLKKNGSVIINISDTIINGEYSLIPERFVTKMVDEDWKVNSVLIWSKQNPPYTNNTIRPTPCNEFIYQFYLDDKPHYDSSWVKKSPEDIKNIVYGDTTQTEKKVNLRSFWRFGDDVIETNVNNISQDKNALKSVNSTLTHPAMMNELVAKILLKTFVRNEGGVVVDIFNGANTIGICCEELFDKVDFVGYELNPSFYNQSILRTELAYNQKNKTQIKLVA
jgi:DNA modification methylase